MRKFISMLLIMVFLVILCSTLTLANPDYYPYEFSYPSHHTSPVLISLGIGGATFLVLYTIINHFHPSTPVVEFTSENVSINLHPDSVQVEGIYTFSNLHNQENKVKISYPFVINEFIGAPTSITVQTDNGQTLEYKLQDDAIQFELVVPPQSSRNLSISFTQPCYDGGFTYVLTTTQSWGKPLVSAVFTVNVDNTISEFQSNYTLEQVDKTDAFTSYSYQTENFNPDQDMQFSWNEGK